jgi:imidazolonepropionase-like amidohydrolase
MKQRHLLSQIRGATIFRLMSIGLILMCCFFVSTAASAEHHAKEIYIKAGRMFDSENGKFVASRIIKVVGRRIVEISKEMDIPKVSQVIDLSDKTVLPGLIDAHTHLMYLERLSGNPDNLTMQGLKAVLLEGDALRALHGAARAKTFLEAGITAIQDVGNCGRFADVALKIAIQDGSVLGPRMRVSGPGLSAVGGQFPKILQEHQNLIDYEYRVVRGIEDGIQAVRENVNMGVDLIKVYADNAPNKALLSVEEIAAIVKEAHRYGLRVTAHAVHNISVRNAVLAGVDGVDHVYSVTDDTLKLIKKKGVIVIPTYSDRKSYMKIMKLSGRIPEDKLEASWKQFSKMFRNLIQRFMKHGITVASGSDMYIDMQCPQGKAAKRVLYSYFECGMPAHEVLRTTSVNAARHLGMEGQIGVIKPKAYADIIAVDGNPEKDIYCLDNVVFVMKDGKVYVK